MSRRPPAPLSAEPLEAREVPATAYGLGVNANANILFRFDTAAPGTVTNIPVTGLTAGDTLVGIDFRPATAQLYGVGANTAAGTVRVYTIDLTGAAAALGAPVPVAGISTAANWGVDFNPMADRIRVVNDVASDGAGPNVNNFRLHPGTGALAGIDPDLDFAALPVGSAPEVAVAYTNSQFGPAPATTTLFGIVTGGDQLVTHTTSPGFQTLNPVGPLGLNFSDLTGLDIFGPNNGANSTAVAVSTVTGVAQLLTVNLTSGAAAAVGTIGTGALQLGDVAVAPPTVPVIVSGPADGKVQLLNPLGGQLATGAAVTAFANSTANVRSGTADVNRDGTPDLVLVTGPGTPIRVTVLSGVDNATPLVAAFDPFGGNFTGGGFVATGDFNNDGQDDFVVTPDQGGGPRVSIFGRNPDGTTTVLANFLGIDDANFRGGVRAAAGDVNNDNRDDLVVGAGFQGGPRVAVFNGTSLTTTQAKLTNDFFAFPGTDAVNLRNGVFVAVTDLNGDGFDDLVFGGGPGGAPRVLVLGGDLITSGNPSGAQTDPLANFFVAGNSAGRGGVRVAAADLDGDGRGDLVAASGERVAAGLRVYRGATFTAATEPTAAQDLAVFNGAALPGGVFVG